MGKQAQMKKMRREMEAGAQATMPRLVYFMNGLLDCEKAAKKLAKAELTGSEQEKVAKQEILKRLGAIKQLLEEAWKD